MRGGPGAPTPPSTCGLRPERTGRQRDQRHSFHIDHLAGHAAVDGEIGAGDEAGALAVSLGPDIRVNCVSPGWIETKDQGALRRKDHAQHPAGRVGKPLDIAEIVSWLLDRERSGFVTGANFVVDGGMTRRMIYVE